MTVLYLLSEGLSDKQIALALGVTNYTVNKHVGAILAKMDARSRTAAAVMAIRQRLFDDEGRSVHSGPTRRVRRIYGPPA
jgi:DNA-binding NarL/FixJ family response regulator